jgi:hypothetical protein
VRVVEAEIGAIAFEAPARLLVGVRLDTELRLEGFLAAKSKRSRKIVLHVTHIEFVESQGKETQHAPAA